MEASSRDLGPLTVGRDHARVGIEQRMIGKSAVFRCGKASLVSSD